MGKIKKITEKELVGGTQGTDIYPVTSVKAVYDENNERLDNILNRRGVVNISTNYNADHIAEVLTLEQAIAKVPSKDRVLGFQGKFLSENGWKSYVFIGDSIADWTNKTKWNNYLTGTDIVQESGEAEDKVMSQKAITIAIADETTRAKSAEQAIIYDISAHNNGVVFESLSAILSSSNLNTLIPTSVRHGGMSIRFIQSSDNKYVQYRLMSDTFNITVANWERYNDVTASNQSFSDLDISDEEGNVIARFSDGEFQTKNFDTTNTPSQAEDNSTAEFQISDPDGNIIAEFQGGHFRTKEFNSRNVSGAEIVKDAQGRNILLFK